MEKTCTVKISKGLKDELKILSVKKNSTVQSLLSEAIIKYLNKNMS